MKFHHEKRSAEKQEITIFPAANYICFHLIVWTWSYKNQFPYFQ